MMKKIVLIVGVVLLFLSCGSHKASQKTTDSTEKENSEVEKNNLIDYVKKDIVIAHRGSTYWAPEETEPAYRWARNIGADYLELDLQMTKDSVLVAIHDDYLLRTSNVSDIFPKIDKPTTDDLTLKELRSLDFGSWFNKKYPDRARESFVGLSILTLQDVMMIAEGYYIKKDENGHPVKVMENGDWNGKYEYEIDPIDNNNRPGVYAETKKLHLEKLLLKELKQYRWLITDNPKHVKIYKDKVDIANTKGRFILQSFLKESIGELNKYLPGVPKCFLLWKSDMLSDNQLLNEPKQTFKEIYTETIKYCVDNKVDIVGSSIAGIPNKYAELTSPWMVDLVHKSGMIVHPYTFDGNNDFNTYGKLVDGVFTNRADLALIFYGRLTENKSDEILNELGY